MENIIQLTKDLIRFKSVQTNPQEIHRCADFIENYLLNCQADYQRLNHQNIPSFLVMPKDNIAPILLMSHFDVVDGADELFEPLERDGKLFGRGSLDDKYAVALSLVLLKKNLQRQKKIGSSQSDLPFGILLTGDEEIGGANGAKKALEMIKTDFCIALDGGNVNKIIIKEKGIAHVKLIVKGKPAHSARPWLGKNAIEDLIADYMKLKDFFDRSGEDLWHRTINLSKIAGGKSVNQVPDYAEAILDIRYTEHDDIDKLLDQMQKAIKGRLVLDMLEPLFLGNHSPYLDLLTNIVPKVRVGSEHGASDARYLSELGINGVVWGADGDLSHHSSREHVKIESVYNLFSNLDKFLQKAAEIPQLTLSCPHKV